MITNRWLVLFVWSYGHRKIGRTGDACWLLRSVGRSVVGEVVALKENERTLGVGSVVI